MIAKFTTAKEGMF